MKQSCIYAEENMTYQEYKTEYDISLDPDQDKACEKTGGHILLLAVPGSGKTTVMTAKLGYLVKGLGGIYSCGDIQCCRSKRNAATV